MGGSDVAQARGLLSNSYGAATPTDAVRQCGRRPGDQERLAQMLAASFSAGVCQTCLHVCALRPGAAPHSFSAQGYPPCASCVYVYGALPFRSLPAVPMNVD
eukprot:scaffold11042_cov137-Isochrysis_galbana.AAC.2